MTNPSELQQEVARDRSFIDNLGKVYAFYTLGFLGFFILMAILEQLGVGARAIGIMFLGFTLVVYAVIGWLSRTMQVDAYYVAGREVPAVYNGMATAADWMSGASFVALAGGIYFGGYQYLGFVIGWTGGYVLVNALLAPYLRKFGCYTVPDFIGTRYEGNFARFVAVVILVVASFTYVTAQIIATGTIAARAFGIPFGHRCLGRPARHPALLDARRHARRDLDPGGAVHRADHRLPGAGLLDVERPGPRPDPAVRLRRGCAGGRGARAAVRPATRRWSRSLD